MKYATRILALTLTMLPLLAAAQLASGEKIVAQVPFEFVLGNKTLPAGEWTVQRVSMDSTMLVLRNTDASVAMLSRPTLAEAKKAAGNYALVFHKYGNSYFLSGVEIADSQISYRLPETKAEAEMLAQNNVAPAEEIVLASLK